MRHLPPAFVALGLAGCLSAPTGQAPGGADAGTSAWPPPSAEIIAHASGDLDGDGIDDVVALDATSARVYLLRGGTGHDVDPTRTSVTTATRSAELAGLGAPAAVGFLTYDKARRVVILDTPAGAPRLTVLGADLATVSTSMLGVPRPAATGAVTLTPSTFGQDGASVFGAVPGGAFFLEGAESAKPAPKILNVPSTGGSAFNDVVVADGYLKTGGTPTPRIVISERTLAQRSDAVNGAFAFTTVRTAGPAWAPQVVADITGDDLPDIIGYDANGTGSAQICALDVESPLVLGCLQTPFGMDTTAMVVGPAVAAGQLDVILVNKPPTGGGTTVFVLANLIDAANVLMAEMPNAQPPTFAVDLPTVSLAQLDAGPREVLLVGKDGTIVCVRARLPTPVTCDQP